MNAYLSCDEKTQLVRMICLQVLLGQAIDIYAELKSTDRTFLAELRHSKTRLEKAIHIRCAALEPAAEENLHTSAAKLNLMFLPTPEAKKAYIDMAALKSVLPISAEDFQDWYEFVIESSCKVCARTDYEACPARRVLAKYDVFPVDPEARGKCQYSYGEGSQVLASAEVIAAEVASTIEIEDADAGTVDIEPLEEEDAFWDKEDRLPTLIGLSTGQKLELNLSEHMVTNLLSELKNPNRKSRALCADHVDGELIVIDMQEVITMQVIGLDEDIWQQIIPAQPPALTPAQALLHSSHPEYEDNGERERYRVECKCGTEYNCNMNPGRLKARCRDCKATVFADRAMGTVDIDGEPATLLTNRYWVERGDAPVPEPMLKTAKGNGYRGNTKGYADPCDPFSG